jgi:hypothetical protein
MADTISSFVFFELDLLLFELLSIYEVIETDDGGIVS